MSAPAPALDLLAAARQRLARAGGAPGASVNRAEWRAAQALQCIGVLAQAAHDRRQGGAA